MSAALPTNSGPAATAPLLQALKVTLGSELVDKYITQCRILLVGAGGIGCELLKNLALSGFAHVTVIDLDTIDVSNLNRQLLFRAQHVGRAKCTTAAQVATALARPLPVDYQAKHANVCDAATFDVNFVKTFDLVLNALDNLTARRRVNRLCLAAQVPLVEAGTTGYLGQVNVIHGGETACYECQTVETPKVYPICTIRATPSRPVHTIVWAKEFYKLLFGAKVQESMLFEDVSTLEGEVSTYMDTVEKVRAALQQNKDENDKKPSTRSSLIVTLVQNLYHDEIQKQLQMDRFKAAAKKPQPIAIDDCHNTQKVPAPTTLAQSYKATDVDCWKHAAACVAELQAVLEEEHAEAFPESFDKDFEPAMRFVTAASNLRNLVFFIEPLQSLYSAKGIAGNIIPAIATTNAIAAGLQMLQVYQILAVKAKQQQMKDQQQQSSLTNGDTSAKTEQDPKDGASAEQKKEEEEHSILNKCRYQMIVRNPTRNGLVIVSTKLQKPNPNCFVCRQGTVELTCHTQQWTLRHFLKRILQQELGLQEPSIHIGATSSTLIWEQGEDSDQALFEINLPKTLAQLPAGGIQHGSIVRVDDFTQALEFSIHVSHQSDWPVATDGKEEVTGTMAEEFPFVMKGGQQSSSAAKPPPVAAAAAAVTNGQAPKTAENEDDDDMPEVLSKRKVEALLQNRGENGSASSPAKKRRKMMNQKLSKPQDEDVVMIVDDDE